MAEQGGPLYESAQTQQLNMLTITFSLHPAPSILEFRSDRQLIALAFIVVCNVSSV